MTEEIQWPSKLVRQTFIDYFVNHGHTFYKSSPVVPLDDPTLLFANAGMNQYKPIFLGHVDPTSPLATLKRACNTQKCIRAGGKHNDLEDVGKDVYHHTFFEMLGNWSFGDYFKKEAIGFAWELLTTVYKLDKSRLYATYFAGDEKDGLPADNEARGYWLEYLPADHVIPFGRKENFWEMGEVGPCGPCSEIHYDRIGGRDASAIVNQDDPNVLEIWNLVFMQFNRELNGSLTPLPACHIDTGMGFERITSVLQGKMSNYDTDIFTPLFDKIHELSSVEPYTRTVGNKTEQNLKDMAYRVVADHIRTLTFSITDGAIPSNSGRGYVLRRILRRGVRYGQQILKCQPGFFSKLVPVLIDTMGDVFPELKEKVNYVQEVILDEETSFNRTLERGLKRFQQEVDSIEMSNKENNTNNKTISGEVAFFLYGTLGFPIDLTQLMAEERGYQVDITRYNECLEEARNIARAGGKDLLSGKELELQPDDVSSLHDKNTPKTDDESKYIWYQQQEAKILAIFTANGFVDQCDNTETVYGIILDKSNFYGEMGGQVTDTGILYSGENKFNVSKCISYAGYLLHYGKIEANTPATAFSVNASVLTDVDYERRICIACNHTMTHAFNWALRDTVKGDIDQKGSLVDEAKMRFDFNMNRGLNNEEIASIESKVTDIINKAYTVYTRVSDLNEAKKINTLRAVFGETYPNPVRVVSIGVPVEDLLNDPSNEKWYNYSVEFCGGTHLSNTAQAKYFVLCEEGSIAKGIRRVTCLTHDKAYEAIEQGKELETQFSEARALTGPEFYKSVADLQQKITNCVISLSIKNKLRDELKALEKRMIAEKKAVVIKRAEVAMKTVEEACAKYNQDNILGGVLEVEIGTDGNTANKLMMKIRELCPDASVLLYSIDKDEQKIGFYTTVSAKHLEKGLNALNWLKEVAAICNGKGGGKNIQAQGQAKDIAHIEDAVKLAQEIFAKYN